MTMNYADLTGQRFGRLTVLEDAGRSGDRRVLWRCRCECGAETTVRAGHLQYGATQSCGCLGKERRAESARRSYIDRRGQVFGRLAVVDDVGRDKWGAVLWLCLCECGTLTTVRSKELRRGDTRSCGCLRRENARRRFTTHGLKSAGQYHPVYTTWNGIKHRCLNPKSISFLYYGGRGIRICDGLQRSFPAFLAAVGPKPSPKHSVDRADNDAHYSCGQCDECRRNGWPMNLRWATSKEQQANNRRHARAA